MSRVFTAAAARLLQIHRPASHRADYLLEYTLLRIKETAASTTRRDIRVWRGGVEPDLLQEVMLALAKQDYIIKPCNPCAFRTDTRPCSECYMIVSWEEK